MISLAQAFPEQMLTTQIEKRLKAGAVVKYFCEFTTPPKYKFLMVASTEPKLLVFIINSKINPFIAGNPDLLADQVEIIQAEHDFLTHDSFLNCIEAHRAIDLSTLKTVMLADFQQIYQGHLSDQCLHKVLNVVALSKNLFLIIKKQIKDAICTSPLDFA